MKLATPSQLRKLTGQKTPQGQYDVLTRELGIRPIFIDGKVRVYQEVIMSAMEHSTPAKPELNI